MKPATFIVWMSLQALSILWLFTWGGESVYTIDWIFWIFLGWPIGSCFTFPFAAFLCSDDEALSN